MNFDGLRAARPGLGLAVYAYEPGGPVTLETLTAEGETRAWTAPTLAGCIAAAFPAEAEPAPAPFDVFS